MRDRVTVNGIELAYDERPRTTCPLLLVHGFTGAADELQRGITHAARVTITDAAHSPQLENPQAWFTAGRDHLVRVRLG